MGYMAKEHIQGIKKPSGGLVRKEECLKFLNNEYLYKLSDGINSLG